MRRKALLIATADYADPDLRSLKSPVADLRARAKLLRDAEVGFFDHGSSRAAGSWSPARTARS